jgi:hypothetical protein
MPKNLILENLMTTKNRVKLPSFIDLPNTQRFEERFIIIPKKEQSEKTDFTIKPKFMNDKAQIEEDNVLKSKLHAYEDIEFSRGQILFDVWENDFYFVSRILYTTEGERGVWSQDILILNIQD